MKLTQLFPNTIGRINFNFISNTYRQKRIEMNSMVKAAFFIVCLFFAGGIAQVLNGQQTDSTKVHFLIISDSHGFYDSKMLYPKRKKYGLKYVAELAVQLRKKYKDLIVLNAGDFLFGSELSRYYMMTDTPTDLNAIHRIYELMNPMIFTLGNHDLEFYSYQRPYLLKNRRLLTVSNVTDAENKELIQPVVTYPVEDITLKVIGVTTYGSVYWNDPSENKRVRIIPPETALEKVFNKMPPQMDRIIIGLFHTGMNRYRDFSISRLYGKHPFNQTKYLLQQFSGFDLVVSGHDHRLNPNKNSAQISYFQGTPVIEAGYWGKQAVFVTLSKNRKTGKTSVESFKVHEISQLSDKNDRSPLNNFNGFFDFLENDTHWKKISRINPEPCLNRILSESVRQSGNEITMLPPLKLKPLFLNKNKTIRRKHLFYWLPYPNKTVRVNMNPDDISALNALSDNSTKTVPYNQNVRFYFPETKENELTARLLNKKNFETYQRNIPVIMVNYHANGGGGLKGKIFLNAKDISDRPGKTIDTLMFEYLKKNRPPDYCPMFTKNTAK